MYHGCPKFVEMPAWARRKVCIAASVCMKCLYPGVVYDPTHNDSCKIVVDSKANNKKAKFTCKVGRCNYNCWMCSIPQADNKDLLDEIKSTMKAKGLTMGVSCEHF